jgi:hypothetical protein
MTDGRRQTWFSSLVCRLNQPMRLTQAELEWSLDLRSDKAHQAFEAYKNCRCPRELEEIMTRRELATLREMACLREIACLREAATLREFAGLREAAAMRKPQILRGLDMRGWLAAPLTSGAGANGRNLGLIQLSDKYDGEFTEEDEAALAQIAHIVSIAVENRWRWRREQMMREAAERESRAKEEFMAMISYRLRAQLNTLLGWSWVLRRQAENMEDVSRAAEIIERAARTQAGLVEELLGASRKGIVKWREGGRIERNDGGNKGWGEGETEGWREGETQGRWEREMEEWREGETRDFSTLRGLSVSSFLRPNSAARRLAAGGGC